MAEIFISYSRRDSTFVHRLHDAFSAENREVWVDWEGILPTAEWRQEITTAIEETDAFVFIISPDSTASEVCRRELSIAVEQNKRLIPILFRAVDDESVPEALAKLNWIDFRHEDDFSKSFNALVKAIDIDLYYLQAHTHILKKSLDWERKAKDRSLLLRGKDLRNAEEWLAANSGKSPAATTLQTHFILTSRKLQTKQLRMTLGAAAAAIVVLAGAVIIATYQKQMAQKRFHIIQARQLATQAEINLSLFPERSLLLAVESASRKTGGSRNAIPVAENTLRSIISEISGIPLDAHQGMVSAIAFDSKNRRLAAGGSDHMVNLWDLTRLGDNPVRLSLNLKELSLLKFGPSGDWLAGLDAYGSAQLWNLRDLKAMPVVMGGYGYSESSIQFSPNGRILAFANGEKQALLCDLQHASDRPVVLQHEGRVISYAFAPGSDRFATISGESAIYLWNFADRFSKPFILESAQIPISSIVFDPVKPRLVGAGSTGELLIWDLRNLSAPPNIFPGDLQGNLKIVLSPNGKWLITSSENGQELWDMAQTAPQRLQLPESRQNLFFDQEQSSYPPKKHILFTGDSEWLAVQTESQLRVWNLADGQPISSIMPDTAPIKTMIICQGANSLLAARDINDNVHLWTLSGWGIHHRTFKGLRGEAASLALSNDGKWLAGGNYSGRVRLWNILEKDEKIDPYRFYSSYSTIDYQGRRLAAEGYRSVEIRDLSQDLENMKVIREYPFTEPLSAMMFSPTGNLLVAGGDNGILRLWDMRVPESKPLEFKTEGSAVAFLDVSVDEKYLAAGFSDNVIWLWDLYNPSAGREKLTEKSIRASRVKFGPAGRWLAMADGGSQIYLWDMETRQRNPIILGNSENRLKTFAFDPEKSQFATGSWEGQVQVWNLNEVSSGPKDLAGQKSAVTAMTFSTDGHWLAIGGADGSVRLWNAADPMQFVKLPAHVSRTAAIAFNADSSLLASGNDDGLLRLWDMNDLNAEPIILSGYPGKVEAVFFDPQNRWLYITANNGVQAFWRLSLKRLKDTACRAAGRNLTCEEWRRYLLDEPYRATCPDFPAPQHCN